MYLKIWHLERILLKRGCKNLLNEPDSLGNTPLRELLVRYALEEARCGYDKWNKWDILHLVRFFLQNGVKNCINQAGNSALAKYDSYYLVADHNSVFPLLLDPTGFFSCR